MLSNAFKSAETSRVAAQTQGINTITSGIKDAGIAVMGAMGFGGGLGSGAVAKGAKHALAGRIGGIGGNIMLATMEEKKATTQAKQNIVSMLDPKAQEVAVGALGDNPINRSAVKQLNTVFETLQMANQKGLMTKEGKISSPMGDVDPNSTLGKKIMEQLAKEDKE